MDFRILVLLFAVVIKPTSVQNLDCLLSHYSIHTRKEGERETAFYHKSKCRILIRDNKGKSLPAGVLKPANHTDSY